MGRPPGRGDRRLGRARGAGAGPRGTAIISHEILATASRSQVGRALTSLGHGDGAEIHVILSVRDLVAADPGGVAGERQAPQPASTYGEFLEQIQDPERASRIGTWFWGVQEIPDILNRWGHDLPPERVHLVTVPPPGGAPDLLWKRFSQAFGLDGIDLDLEAERANPSLGVPETALIRRINRNANRDAPAGRLPAAGARAARPPDAVPAHPVAPAGAAAGRSTRGSRDLSAVVGRRDRAARLRRRRRPRTTWSARPPEAYADPDQPVERRWRGAGVDAIKALLLENARLRQERGAAARRARTRRTAPWSAPTCARRTGCARRSSAGCRRAGRAGGC